MGCLGIGRWGSGLFFDDPLARGGGGMGSSLRRAKRVLVGQSRWLATPPPSPATIVKIFDLKSRGGGVSLVRVSLSRSLEERGG